MPILEILSSALIASAATSIIFVQLGKSYIKLQFDIKFAELKREQDEKLESHKRLENERLESFKRLENEKLETHKRSENELFERFRREQNHELERQKSKINMVLDRFSKVHSKEFEVMPEAWLKVRDAMEYVLGLASPFFLSSGYDFEKMSDDEIRGLFPKDITIFDYVLQQLKDSDDKEKTYQELTWRSYLVQARRKSRELNAFLTFNGIFMPSDIKEMFIEIEKAISFNLIDIEVSRTYNNYQDVSKAAQKVKELSASILPKLESAIQSRLQISEQDED